MDQKESVWKYLLPKAPKMTYAFESNLLGGIGVVYTEAKIPERKEEKALYTEYQPIKWVDTEIKLIPYYAWANRNEGNMEVWINHQER